MSEKFLNSDRISELWSKTKEYVDNAVSGSGDTAVLVKSPIGTIVIWSGTADNIPTGWQLCDGTNGTPDLRDKFVLGAGNKYAVGATGGSEEVTLTASQMPEHNHGGTYYSGSGGSNKFNSTNSGTKWMQYSNDSTGIYNLTSTAGGSEPHPNMPPYYALCYIMKITADPADGVTQEELTAALADKQNTLVDGTGTTIQGNAVNVTTPVNGIVTQQEFDALPYVQKNTGMYVVKEDGDGSGGGGSSGGVPSGFIGMWSGEVVPDGWLLCNGENGTPDLRDRFVLGSGMKYSIGKTGGAEVVTLTVEQLPSHSHKITHQTSSSVSIDKQNCYARGNTTSNTYEQVSRTGDVQTIFGGVVSTGKSHQNMPPYYVLAFIMKS